MNRRETLALHRLGVMRLRARAAAHQRRLAALADASHQQQLDNCPCQTCSLRRTLTQALSGGIPVVTLEVGGAEEPKADDTTPKH